MAGPAESGRRVHDLSAYRSAGDRRSPRLAGGDRRRSEEHTSELQSLTNLVCRLLLEKKKLESLIAAIDEHNGRSIAIPQYSQLLRVGHKNGPAWTAEPVLPRFYTSHRTGRAVHSHDR